MKLTTCDLTKRFGTKTAVDRLNLELGAGVIGLLGPNGAGKTTLIRMLCDLLKPTEGKVLLDGEDIHLMDEEYRGMLGYLPQRVGYYPWFTGEEYLRYLACLKGMSKKETEERIDWILDQVSLEDVRKKKIRSYSGGMIQRLGIAQSLLNDPAILILDEPTAGLDPRERIRFRNLIAQLSERRLILLSTHIVSDVESVATDIIIFKAGKIVLKDERQDILKHMQYPVCSMRVPVKDVEMLKKQYVLSQMQPAGDDMEVRIICREEPPAGALMVEPDLEELYLSQFIDEMKAGDGHVFQ